VAVHVAAEATITMRASVSAALTPGDQHRGWRRRWQEAQRDLGHLLSPQSAPMSADSIHAAGQRLHAFFVQTYHIKDALKNESASTGIQPAAVENAIGEEPALALLADVANLDKHGKLIKPPRSGHTPSIVSLAGDSANQAPGTWRLRVTIGHAGRLLDGLQVAQDAVDAWRRTLSGWGLI
jgi:hypothetical protein